MKRAQQIMNERVTLPKPPRGLKRRGRALWTSVVSEDELAQHQAALLLEACRTVDLLDDLAAVVGAEGAMEPGTGRAHPAAVEASQQGIALAWLQAARRPPARDEDSGDVKPMSRRPQRRAGAGGVYRLRVCREAPG